jgi:hypothetical protein
LGPLRSTLVENDDLLPRSKRPFAIATSVAVIVTLTVFRLPDLVVDQLRRNRVFDSGQAGWLYRLLALAAAAQAAYIGFVLLRSERVEEAWKRDPKLTRMHRSEVFSSVVRNAAGMPLLTLVYGITAFVLTGERAGFWLFVVLTAAQIAWYYRQVGIVGRWLGFQPEYIAIPGEAPRPEAAKEQEKPDEGP